MGSLLARAGLRFEDPREEQAFVDRYANASTAVTQVLLITCGVIFYVFFLWDEIIDPVHWQRAHFIRGVIGTPLIWLCAAALWLKPVRQRTELVLSVASVVAAVGLAVIYNQLDRGYDYGAVGFVMVILVACALFHIRATYVAAILATICAAAAIGELASPSTSRGMWIVNGVCLAGSSVIGIISVVRRELIARAEMRLTGEVAAARDRIEELLHSVLPSEIVSRIQRGETAIADAYGEVSIVFADLVGFTELSRRITPAHLVEILNRFFSEFDARAEAHGLERIKTIGDAYMAVGGLGHGALRGDHARAAAEFALEAQEVVNSLGAEFELPLHARVGLHIGPVVAGVIGTKRPAFDCWGESVNLASRLEGAARPGSIIISESAYWRLKAHFPIEVLDEVDLKGIGPTKLYLLGKPAKAAAEVG